MNFAVQSALGGSLRRTIDARQLQNFPAAGQRSGRFFMTLRDIAFWIRSARADSRIQRLRHARGAAAAFDKLYEETNDPFGAEMPQYRYQQRKYDSLSCSRCCRGNRINAFSISAAVLVL